MGCMQSSGNPSRDHPPASEIAGIEPVHICVRVEHDLETIELKVADEGGRGFSVLFAPDAALDVMVRFTAALSRLRGSNDVDRMHECQRLLRVLREACGLRQGEIARKIGVGDALISRWSRGHEAPSAERLEQLRRVVKSAPRHD
jgi:DNA-binding XRE family transcriptional regulator